MSLILRLASRNLFQDRLRFIATVVGIVFSIVLVMVQMGLFLSFERMVTTMIDHASADLWIVPLGTKCFEDPSLLDEHDRAHALSVKGVTDAVPVVIGFTDWAVPTGGTTPIFIIGSSTSTEGVHPWNVVQGNLNALSTPHAVAIDQTYFARLGITRIGESTEIREQRAQVMAITNGIRSFTTTPYIFTALDRAQAYIGTSPNRVSYFLVHVSPGADVAAVRKLLLANLTKVEVLTPDEFRSRSRAFWLLGTGAGAALFAGALLGVIGFFLAACVGLIIVEATAETALPIVMTPLLTLGLFLLTVLMCVASAVAAIVQVMRIDLSRVFRQ